MHDVRRVGGTGHREVARQRVEKARMPWLLRRHRGRRPEAAHAEIATVLVLLAEAEHIHVMRALFRARELPGEILDVHARSAVDVGRVLVGEETDAQRGSRLSAVPPAR